MSGAVGGDVRQQSLLATLHLFEEGLRYSERLEDHSPQSRLAALYCKKLQYNAPLS